MAEMDPDVLTIVWTETNRLKPRDSNQETMQRLQVVVAKLATEAKRRGLQRKLKEGSVPSGLSNDLPAFQAMQSTVNAAIDSGWKTAVQLPARAALWEINEAGLPYRDRPLPLAVAWILDQDITHGGDFAMGDGAALRTFRLFESAKAAPDGELPYISNLTGSGVPVAAPAPRRWYKSSSWWIGLSGGALFFLAAFSLLWTSSSFSHAYDILSGRQAGQVDAFVTWTKCANVSDDMRKKFCVSDTDLLPDNKKVVASDALQKKAADFLDQAKSCVGHLTTWAGSEQTARDALKNTGKFVPALRDQQELDVPCLELLGYAVTYSARNLVVPADGPLGSAVQRVGYWLFGWHVPTDGTQAVSIALPAVIMMLGVILVLVGLGKGVEGTPLGALIDSNHRYSLALAQVTFWTVLILTGAMAIAIFNGGLVADFVRYFPDATSQPKAAADGFFPYIPAGIWSVLGISFGSTVLSSLVKSLKGSSTRDASELSLARSQTKGGLSFFQSPIVDDPGHRGSVADWFLGEEAATLDKIDISRVQMVVITTGLLVTYGNAIFASLRGLSPQEILLAIQNVDVLVATLPPVGASMAIMLSASHATYLVAKAADAQAPAGKKEAAERAV